MFGARHDEGNGRCLHWFHFHYTALTAKPFIFFGVPLSSLCFPYVSLGSVGPSCHTSVLEFWWEQTGGIQYKGVLWAPNPKTTFPLQGMWRRINKPSIHSVNQKKTKTNNTFFYPNEINKSQRKCSTFTTYSSLKWRLMVLPSTNATYITVMKQN